MMAKSTVGSLADDFDGAAVLQDWNPAAANALRYAARVARELDGKTVSDGYHTFAELYAHRRALVLMLMRSHPSLSWITRAHHPEDGPMFDDSFMIGIDSPAGEIRYHVGVEHWALFAGVREVEHATPWDGAGPAATVERLHAWSGMMFADQLGADDEEPEREDRADELETEPYRYGFGDPLG